MLPSASLESAALRLMVSGALPCTVEVEKIANGFWLIELSGIYRSIFICIASIFNK
jgi:hypothetical protein